MLQASHTFLLELSPALLGRMGWVAFTHSHCQASLEMLYCSTDSGWVTLVFSCVALCCVFLCCVVVCFTLSCVVFMLLIMSCYPFSCADVSGAPAEDGASAAPAAAAAEAGPPLPVQRYCADAAHVP